MPAKPSGIPPVVIVVDDEVSVLRMMTRALLMAGYAVYAESNGPDAIATAAELPRRPDIVVTHLRMSPMGGAEPALTLFARGLASRFLFVTGFGPDPEYDERLGPLLAKPFSPDRLVIEVERMLSQGN